MISWIVIIGVVLLAFLILKVFHLKHRLTLFFFFLVLVFLYFSFTMVASNHGMDFSSTESSVQSVKIYLSWLGNGMSNLKSLTGYAVGMDWKKSSDIPMNKTK